MTGEMRTRENGAHCVIAHENPVSVMSTVAPVTFDVKLKVRRTKSSISFVKSRKQTTKGSQSSNHADRKKCMRCRPKRRKMQLSLPPPLSLNSPSKSQTSHATSSSRARLDLCDDHRCQKIGSECNEGRVELGASTESSGLGVDIFL